MNWMSRLNRASEARRFQPDDIVAAFDSKSNLLEEFNVARDQYGQAFDGALQALSDRFGWSVLCDRVADALVTFQAVAERAGGERKQLAA